MNWVKITLLTLLATLTMGYATAQKVPYLQEQEEVVQHAKAFLDEQMTADLLQWAQKYGVSGNFLLDITVRNKGEVATVFVARASGELKSQNALKDYVFDLKFPFKLPKGKSFKFSYEFGL